MFEGELCDGNGGGDVCGAADFVLGGVDGGEDLAEVLCVCYEDLWAEMDG